MRVADQNHVGAGNRVSGTQHLTDAGLPQQPNPTPRIRLPACPKATNAWGE
jgi:hypothetical protein